jgi:hypothetical protein
VPGTPSLPIVECPALAKAAENLAKAAARLSSETNSINDGLERQFGKQSALVVSLNSVGEMVANGRLAASEPKAISFMMEQRLTSTSSSMLQSGEVLKKAAETVPDLIRNSYEQGSAQMAAHFQTVANNLVDEKLARIETLLKADYEKVSNNIATVTKIVEEIPARIEAATTGKRGIFDWLRKSAIVTGKDTTHTDVYL